MKKNSKIFTTVLGLVLSACVYIAWDLSSGPWFFESTKTTEATITKIQPVHLGRGFYKIRITYSFSAKDTTFTGDFKLGPNHPINSVKDKDWDSSLGQSLIIEYSEKWPWRNSVSIGKQEIE